MHNMQDSEGFRRNDRAYTESIAYMSHANLATAIQYCITCYPFRSFTLRYCTVRYAHARIFALGRDRVMQEITVCTNERLEEQGQEELEENEASTPLLQCRICGGDCREGELRKVCDCSTLVHIKCQLEWCESRSELILPTLHDTIRTCEVCHGQLRNINGRTMYASLEVCVGLLLVALSISVHLLYKTKLRRDYASDHVAALEYCNIAGIAGLLFLVFRVGYKALRTIAIGEKFAVALSVLASVVAGVVVYMLARYTQ